MFPLLLVSAAAAGQGSAGSADSAPKGFWVINTRCAPQDTACYDPARLRFQRWEQGTVEESTVDKFLAALSPEVPVCCFVHGNLTDSSGALQDAWQACRGLCEAGPKRGRTTFVLVSWPSERVLPLTTLDLGVKSERSDVTAHYLASVLTQVPAEQRVCLIGHSLGARTVLGSLELLSGGAVQGRRLPEGHGQGPRHVHAALLAASVDHDWMNRGERYGRALDAVEALMLMQNRRDAALALYPLRKPFSPSALGRTGLHSEDWGSIDADDGAKISEVEVCGIVGCHHPVGEYFGEPSLNALMAPLVYFRSDTASGPAVAGR